MASSALEEKINKIRLQNEEIRRRYEEVEADKKNAAKSNALVQMVPSDDWPERKEPPEFSAPPKNTPKQKVANKEHNDRHSQHYPVMQERPGKKDFKFAQGDGPPPDPKYNFLADSERETRMADDGKTDEDKNKFRNKAPRGAPKRRGGSGGGGSRDAFFKDNRGPHAFHSKEEALPEYEAWRAERNRIDEARINRQKTAEGNWRREWDSNKTNVEKDQLRKGEFNRKDSNNYDRRNNHYDNDYSNRGHGGSRTYHGTQKNHGHQEYRRPHHEQFHEYKKPSENNKPPLSPTDNRTVTATDKSIKVTVNHGNQAKGPLMSVKVNSPSIVGTGRVGPRQKSRVTYSSQSDADVTTHELNNFSRQKSFDEKTAASGGFNNEKEPSRVQKPAPKSPFLQRKKEGNSKSPYPQRKELRNDESSVRVKHPTKPGYPQRNEAKDLKQSNNYPSKQPRGQKRSQKPVSDRIRNLSISDDAIPSEYSPDKSFNSENLIEQKVDISDDYSNNSNEINEYLADAPESFNNSETNFEPINQNTCDNNIENIDNDESIVISESNEHIVINENIETNIIENEKIDENIETNIKHEEIDEVIDANIKHEETNEITDATINHEKIDENVDTSIDHEKTNENIEINIEHEETNKNIDTNITHEKINENDHAEHDSEDVKIDTVEIESPNKILQDDSVEKKNEESLSKDEPEIIKTVEKKNDVCTDTQEEVKAEIFSEEVQVHISENIQENKLIKIQENNETKETVNDESHKTVVLETDSVSTKETDDILNKPTESNEIKTNDLDISPQKSTDDSGFIDHNITNESIESDETKIREADDSQDKSINDSGFVNESDVSQDNVNTLIIESNENNTEERLLESVKSDLANETKEICEKAVEICDISSAVSNETSQAVKNDKEHKHIQKTDEIESPTKVSDVDTVKVIEQISESPKLPEIQNVIQHESAEKENSLKEESTKIVTEESKEE